MYNNLSEYYLAHDKPMTILRTVLFTLIGVMMFLTGIAIWPAVFYAMSTENAFQVICRNIAISNAFILLLEIAYTAFILFSIKIHFFHTAIINLLFGIIGNFIVLLRQCGLFLTDTNADFMIVLLWFFFSFFLALILSIIPALVIAGIGKLIRHLVDLQT